MDPTTLWTELKENMTKLQQVPEDLDLRDKIAEQLADLRMWIRRGGFAPTNL